MVAKVSVAHAERGRQMDEHTGSEISSRSDRSQTPRVGQIKDIVESIICPTLKEIGRFRLPLTHVRIDCCTVGAAHSVVWAWSWQTSRFECIQRFNCTLHKTHITQLPRNHHRRSPRRPRLASKGKWMRIF